jgi:hypothetical protein
MDVVRVGEIVILMLFPTLAVGALLHLPGWYRSARRFVDERHPDADPQPTSPPIEQLAADLRRLLAQHETVRRSPGVAVRGRHLRALEYAITDCATDAARALGLPYPERPAHGSLARPELSRLLQSLARSGLMLPPASGLLAA